MAHDPLQGTPTMTGLDRPDRRRDPDADDEENVVDGEKRPESHLVPGETALMGDGQVGGETLTRDDERNPEGTHDIAHPVDRPTGA